MNNTQDNKPKLNIKCEYCLNVYRKSSIKQHLLRCKEKIEYDKNEIIKINSSKKFIENNDFQNNKLDDLPNEIIFLITSYLMDDLNKDEYCSYRRLYKEYLNICFISKRIYNILYPTFETILIFKKNLYEERDKRICKSTAKSLYKLTETQLEDDIPYILVKNPHYSSSPPMKIYQIADILDYMYDIYQSKDNHDNLLMIKEQKKEISREKRNIAKEKRDINFNKLMNSYNLNNNTDIYQDLYDDYINKGTPSLKKIEEQIKYYIECKKRKNNIFSEIAKRNLDKYKTHSFITEYIEEGHCKLEETIEYIQNIYNRETELKNMFIENNLIFEIEYNVYHQKSIIYNYIENNIGNSLDIVQCIAGKNDRKYKLMEEFHKNNLILKVEKKKNNECTMINDFIEYNKGSIESIIEYIIGKKNRELNINNMVLNHNLAICKRYIENSNENLEDVKNKIYVHRFFIQHTNFKEEIINIRKYNIDDDYGVVSELAKKKALRNWCKKYNSYETAISEQYLPHILYKDINDIYNNILDEKDIDFKNIKNAQIKCKCDNVASIICKHCKHCCNIDFCIRHNI